MKKPEILVITPIDRIAGLRRALDAMGRVRYLPDPSEKEVLRSLNSTQLDVLRTQAIRSVDFVMELLAIDPLFSNVAGINRDAKLNGDYLKSRLSRMYFKSSC